MPRMLAGAKWRIQDQAISTRGRLAVGTWNLTVAVITIGFFAGLPPLAIAAAYAALLGWYEIDGYCGASHISTLTPLRQSSAGTWLKAVLAYTGGGLITAGCVGAAIGVVGSIVSLSLPSGLVIVAGLSACLAARELLWPHLSLPQIHRQTQRMWAYEFGLVAGPMMWGAHIGLGFATVIAHGGFFVVVIFAASVGTLEGALMMMSYWIGRTLPIWLGPILVATPLDGSEIAQDVFGSRSFLNHAAGVSLSCISIAAAIHAFSM